MQRIESATSAKQERSAREDISEKMLIFAYLKLIRKKVMNLRDFKKDVDYFVGDFIDDCTLFLQIHPDKAPDEVADIMEKAVDLYNDLKDKANVKVEGKKSVYYNSLRMEMVDQIGELYEKLSEIVSSHK